MVIFKIRRYWRFTKNSDASNSLSCVKEVLNMMGKNTFGKLFTNLWFSRTTLCDKVCQWLAAGWWFSPGFPVSSTNKTDCHDKAEILLKVALNTIKQTNETFGTTYLNSISYLLPFTDKSRRWRFEEATLRATCKWPYVMNRLYDKYGCYFISQLDCS